MILLKRIYLIVVVVILNACDSAISQVTKLTIGDVGLELKNGVLEYNHTPFNGALTGYDSVNKTYSEVEYVDGKKHGEERKIYDNKVIAEIRFYKNGYKVGTHKGWYNDGNVKFEYHYNDRGMYNGSFKEWYTNGQPLKSFNFKNGKEDGSQKMWLSNGNIRANYVVKNGERYGLVGLKKCYTITEK